MSMKPETKPDDDDFKKVGCLFVPKTVSKSAHIIQWLAHEMELQVAANDHKDSPEIWRGTDVYTLFKRLDDDRRNLLLATQNKDDLNQVLPEAARVAIAAMRIAYWYESRMDLLDIDGTE